MSALASVANRANRDAKCVRIFLCRHRARFVFVPQLRGNVCGNGDKPRDRFAQRGDMVGPGDRGQPADQVINFGRRQQHARAGYVHGESPPKSPGLPPRTPVGARGRSGRTGTAERGVWARCDICRNGTFGPLAAVAPVRAWHDICRFGSFDPNTISTPIGAVREGCAEASRRGSPNMRVQVRPWSHLEVARNSRVVMLHRAITVRYRSRCLRSHAGFNPRINIGFAILHAAVVRPKVRRSGTAVRPIRQRLATDSKHRGHVIAGQPWIGLRHRERHGSDRLSPTPC